MKKITLYLFVLAVVACVSCNNKAPQDQPLHPVDNVEEYVFTSVDTTEVINLVHQFINYLENKDIRSAVEMLSFLDGDSIVSLTPQFQMRQAISLSTCIGVGYKIDRLVFETDKKNEVKMDITLFEKPAGDPRPNQTSFYFRPVRYNGKWYLTTKDNITDTNSHEREHVPQAEVSNDEEN
jgi:hypothetical protein